MNLSEIQELIKFVSRSGVTEVEIEQKDFKITIKSEGKKSKKEEQTIVLQQAPVATPAQIAAAQAQPVAAAPAPVAAAPAPAAEKPAAPAEDDSKLITIKSPMIGTFYRAPGRGKDNFVNVGDTITSGDV